MSNIRSIITDSLQSQGVSSYLRYAEPVIAALTEREEQAIETIREKGLALGATEEQIETVLIEAGLVEPTPEPVVNTEGGDDADLRTQVASLAEDLRTLTATLNSALEAARRQGVRI